MGVYTFTFPPLPPQATFPTTPREAKQTDAATVAVAQGGEYSSDSRVASDTPAGPMFALIVSPTSCQQPADHGAPDSSFCPGWQPRQ